MSKNSETKPRSTIKNMKLTDSTQFTRSGKLVPLISKWDTEGKGLSREQLRELAEELVLKNPTLTFSTLEQIEKDLIRNHLVAYDTHSGLYFVCVRLPVSPYPDDFKSPSRLTFEELKARHSFEEQTFNRKLKPKYCEARGLQNWFELSFRDFEKWKLENGIVFTPGTVEKTPKVKPEKKPKKKNVKNTSEENNTFGKGDTNRFNYGG